ncbi:MAG: HEAT repeat domain-containing protein, partial [Planctomycetales bacterium]
ADPGAFLKFCGEFINDQGDDKPWTIPTKTIAQVAELLEHAEPRVQARTARLLRKLNENKQNAWNLAWEIHRRRFAEEIPALEQAAQSRQPAELQYGDDDLRRVAFGGYVGLIREQGSARWISPEVMRVRQTALRRAAAMAAEDKQLAESARPVFIQTLGDPQPAVRIQAFEQLQALGMDEGALGAEALETGHTDLGVRGLKFLTEGAAAEQANQVLEGVMLHRNDDLSIEAAKLLIDRTDRPSVAGLAVGGVFQALRGAAMHWLSMDYAESNPAKEIVRKAARSRHRDVRMNAACLLAEKKDPAAFDGLVELLKKPGHYGEWNALIDAFQKSEDPRSTDALIDRVENDPENDAPVDDLIEAAGSFRLPESVDRLLPLMGKKKLRYAACQAVKAVAGYDQYIAADTQRDADAPDAVPDWEQEQRPRRDDLFIRLIERCAELNAFDQISEMMEDALWCRSPDIDPILAKLSGHPEAWFRHEILATIGWRLRNRKGPADALLQALEHSEPDTKFAAAEALAKSRRAEGISVLLAAIELMESEYHRQRAVVALGVLADDRALEVLLKIAADDDHPLQDEAAEAIGHLGESDRAEEIFQLLKQFSKGSQMLAHHALRGLRWFNSPSGWNLIRKKAADPQFGHRETAVDLLESNDDPATRDLLLKLIKEDEEVGGEAFDAARTRFGEDSLEPDYARLQQQDEYCWWGDEALDRVCEKGDPKRILELLPRAQDADVDRLTASLLSQETPPVAEAAAILDSPHEKAVEAAAHLLGRGGKPAAAHKAALETALGKWTAQWEQRQEQLRQGKTSHDRALRLATDCLKTLIWAAGRLNVAGDAVLAAAESHADDVHFRPARLAALSAITEGKPSPAALSSLETAAVGNDPEIRSLAAGALGKFSPKTAEKIAGRLVSDRVSLRRLASGENVDVSAAMRDAAARVHYQGAALPELLAQADAEGLRAVMTDHELPQATRLGGLEGLAKLASEPAETMLVEFAQSQDDSEELRKAAWRGLRRSQRARKKNAAR